ncbi:MAG: hypothetical protein WB952_22345 [Terriglobales bacterium]
MNVFPGLANIDISIFGILWPLAQQTRAIIDRNWHLVEAVATELVKKGGLSGDEVEEIISRHPMVGPA